MEFYLDFEFCKAVSGEEHNGNYVFQVEASNENVDFQDQIVLQSALMKSKDNFLKNGVISYDHLHRRKDENGNMISDPAMIIGEPIDVWTEGDKTFVKGMLYKANEKAQEVVKLLKSGSTRIRASVGGLFPKIAKGVDGIEKIVSVVWNDLALTPCPVNNTVGAASFAKSFTPQDFAKALSTDGDGAVLLKEDVEKKTKNVIDDEKEEGEDNETILKSLFQKIEQGEISKNNEIYDFLISKGLDHEDSWAAAHDIEAISGGNFMAKKGSFSSMVNSILKSMGSEDKPEEMEKAKEIEKAEEIENYEDEEVEVDLDDEEDKDEDEEEMQKGKKTCKKSTDYVDATELLKSLNDELSSNREEINDLKKSLADIGDCMVMMAKAVAKSSDMVKSFSEEPVGLRSTMSKSVNSKSNVPNGTLTEAEFKKAQKVLCKAVSDGEIDLVKSSMIERDMQLAMSSPNHQMKQEHFKFLQDRF